MSTKEGVLKVEKLKRNGWKSCGGVSNGNDLLVWKNFKREYNLPDNYDPPLKKNCVCGHHIEIQCFIYKIQETDSKIKIQLKVLGTECIKKIYNEEYNQLRSENRKECPIDQCGKIHGNTRRTDLCYECCEERCEKCHKYGVFDYQYCYNCKYGR